MYDELCAGALARLDDVEREERERWALEKLEAGIFPALRLLRALLEERRDTVTSFSSGTERSVTDAALREFAGGPR